MKCFVLRSLTIVKNLLETSILSPSTYSFQLLCNGDKRNTLTLKNNSDVILKIMTFHLSCEVNPFWNNPKS